MSRLARVNDFGELRVFEQVANLPDGFEKVELFQVDPVVSSFFLDVRQYYY